MAPHRSPADRASSIASTSSVTSAATHDQRQRPASETEKPQPAVDAQPSVPRAARPLASVHRTSSVKGKEKEDLAGGVVVIEGPLDLADSELEVRQQRQRRLAWQGRNSPPRLTDVALGPLGDGDGDSAQRTRAVALVVDLGEPVTIPPAALWRTRSDGMHDAALATPASETTMHSGATDSTMPPLSTFNSLGSSQRPMFAGRVDMSGAGGDHPGVLESGTSRPSWKKGSGRVRTFEKNRLAALGFEEELTRDFDFWASWGVAVCNIGFLPGTFLGVLTAIDTGGGSMYAFAWPISGLFMCALAAILGEMASTYPVAGAMFTWVFRLCRSSKRFDSLARYASWVTGSFLLCSHILTQIVISYQLSTFFQGFIGMYIVSFEPTFWRSMAIAWAILAFCGLLVSSAWSRSPWLWRLCGAGTVVGFVIMNAVLLAKAPEIRPAREVFFSYGNTTGWKSRSYVVMIGWVLTCVASGVEACSHMAEDTKTPARTVPLAMFWSVALSYAMGWVSICVLLATQQSEGRDRRLVPSIGMLSNTLSRPYATLVSVIILVAMLSQNVAQLLATSRFIWALARESALPFSHLLRTISARRRQPIPAIWVVVIIVGASLLLLRISTRIIGTILLEGAGWTVMFSYLIPIVIYLFCPDDALAGDGRAQWTLRKYSKILAWPVAGFASVFLVMLCLPTGYPVNSLNASYASAVAFSVLFLSTLAWVFYGNARYAGPIKTTTRWTIGAEVELPASTTFKTATLPDETTSAAYGRSAHVFSSFPTLMSNAPAPSNPGEYDGTSGEWSSGAEDSLSPSSTMASGEFARHRGRWAAGTPEEGAQGREMSVTGRPGFGAAGGGSPSASTP